MTSLDLLFWVLWVVTALAAGLQVLRPILTTDGLLGFPFVAGLAWLYFYVYMAYDVAVSLRDFVPIKALCLGQFVALISFLGLVAGWEAAVRKNSPVRVRSYRTLYPADRLWQGGMLFLIAGILGQYTFMAQETVDWRNTSAYWHMLYLLGYPGAALCIAATIRTPPHHRVFRTIALSVAIAILQYPFLLYARRGPLFPAVIMLTFAPILFRGKRPRRVVVVGALGGAGALMMLFLAIRPFIYYVDRTAVSRGWKEGLSDLSASVVLTNRGKYLGDNEYAYHCGAVWTLYRTGLYQYGTGYLTLLTHWVPRQLWQDKPSLSEGLFPDVYGEIPNEMGWQMTNGAAWGGACDVFEEFGFLSPLFWAALAYLAGRSYREALSRRLDQQMTYLGFLAGTHWLVSQGFGAAFVPLCIFTIPPAVFLRYARIEPSFTTQRRSLLPHARNCHAKDMLVPPHTLRSHNRATRPIRRDMPAL
jgi:hypothetical protein